MPTEPALHALGGAVAVLEREGGGVAHPAGEGVGQRRLMALRDIGEGGSAGAAVEIFVGAADRHVGVGGGEIERDRADTVAQIPEDQRACVMRAARPRGHVEAVGGLVMDVGEEDECGIVVDRLFEFGAGDGVEARAGNAGGGALGDVQVGVEIAAFADDRRAAGPRAQCGDDELEEVGRGGIADDNLVGPCADEGGDESAETLGCVDPAFVPAADQALAPLAGGGVGDCGRHRLGERTEGIAVEIDDAVGEGEQVAMAGEWVGGVEGARFGQRRHAYSFPAEEGPLSALRIRRLVSVHAADSGVMSSTWPVRGTVWRSTVSPAARAFVT